LNNTASIGCATGRRGAVAPLYLARNSSELAAFRARSGPRSVALAPLLFALPTLTNLHDALGDALAGVLVLDGPQPRDAPSPEPPSAWVPGGSGLARARWPFGMALLDAAESAAVVAAVDGARRGPPLLELRYPMFASESAPACLAADDCLPLGGYSVWGAVEPRTPTATPPRAGAPAVMLAAPLDATAVFHEHAPGARAAVAPTVALLAAVDAVASLPTLRAQLAGGALRAAPLFGLFAGEAWGGIGSGRFAADVADFNCSATRDAPRLDGGGDDGGALPTLTACARPPRADLRFEALRGAPLTVVGLAAVGGAASADGALYVHTPAPASAADTALAASVTRAAADVRAATGSLGLPPGPATALAGAGGGGAVVLADFGSVEDDGRVGSRFDTAETLDAARVCAAAGAAARAWWALAGGDGTPAPNCTLVEELLRCLLPPPRGAPPPPPAAADAAPAPAACALAAELGLDGGGLTSRYTSVHVRGAVSAPVEFALRLLNRTLARAACADGGGCEPTVLLHEAYSAGIEREAGAWRVVDGNATIWAESNWPAAIGATLWLHPPADAEGAALIGVGVVASLVTWLAVWFTRRAHDNALKEP
jgi:nicastrin